MCLFAIQVLFAGCRDTFHQHRRWTQAELFQRSQHVLFRGYVEEVLLALLKPKFYCAVTLGLQLLGIFHVWSGLLNLVAEMLGTSAWSCHLHFVVF